MSTFMEDDYEYWAGNKIESLLREKYQLRAKVAELQSSHDALESKLEKYENLEPVCYIPDDAIAQLQPPRIRLLGVPLITYHGENHTPLYALEK